MTTIPNLVAASTAAERINAAKDWLASVPAHEDVQAAFKEFANKDKGVAKLLKERLEADKRVEHENTLKTTWSDKATALLAQQKFSVADALAWQRDAAKAGAPLSQPPLDAQKTALQQRIEGIDDLQIGVQVQKEAAVLLAQRIEVLSTKTWQDADAARVQLEQDVQAWNAKAASFTANPLWSSVDVKYEPMLSSSQNQLSVVWQAFDAELAQARQASANADATLPSLLLWASQISKERGGAELVDAAQAGAQLNAHQAEQKKLRDQAKDLIKPLLEKLENELKEGHGKASAEASVKLREALKHQEVYLSQAMASRSHSALSAAGELIDWQRWRADQIRDELIIEAEKLASLQAQPRKLQEALRKLRESWRATDQGGAPNHVLWKKFDHLCNDAHKTVEVWLEKVKEEEGVHVAQREALIAELTALAAEQTGASATESKKLLRLEHEFQKRWRDAGHISEKHYTGLYAKYKAAFSQAFSGLQQAQKSSIERRRGLIEEAKTLATQANLSIAAVQELQARWKTEAQTTGLERNMEQKLWDAFRKPIDEAFAKKDEARKNQRSTEKAAEKALFDAIAKLDAASASGDATVIHAAKQHLQDVMAGKTQAKTAATATATATGEAASAKATLAETPQVAAAEPAQVEAAVETQVTVTEAAQVAAAEATQVEATEATQVEATEAAQVAATEATQVEATESASVESETATTESASAVKDAKSESAVDDVESAAIADTDASAADIAVETPVEAPIEAPAETKAPPKKVIAMRGDDRPGAKPATAVAGKDKGKEFGRNARPGADRGKPQGGDNRAARPERGDRAERTDRSDRSPRFGEHRGDRPDRGFEDRGPRLSPAAQAALRQAREKADSALKNLASQAHGSTLMQLLGAWEQRDAAAMPKAAELGKNLNAAQWQAWSATISKAANASASEADQAILRLEISAEVPSPAEAQTARRMVQLQLLTQRKTLDADQWGKDVAQVFAQNHEVELAKRLQTALKSLLKKA